MLIPKDCRDLASRCIEMANDVIGSQIQNELWQAANTWLNLALDLENSEALREQLKRVSVIWTFRVRH